MISDAKFLAKSLKKLESNCVPLSEINVRGTSNLVTMFSQTKFLVSSSVIEDSGSASIHLVK